MWIVSRRASSEFSRGVERSETPGNRCKIRCFRRNHLGARVMIPCRETRGGEPAIRGYRCAQPPAKFGFFPAGKELSEGSCQFSVFRFQMSARSCRGVWKDARDAGVGYGRASTPPLQRLVNQPVWIVVVYLLGAPPHVGYDTHTAAWSHRK